MVLDDTFHRTYRYGGSHTGRSAYVGDFNLVGTALCDLCGLRVGCSQNLQNRYLYARLEAETEGFVAVVALLKTTNKVCLQHFLPKNLDIVKKCITFAPDSERDLDGGCSSVG